MARTPVRLPPVEPDPLPPAVFEAVVEGLVQLLLADLELDAKLQDGVATSL
jgi:hypothetical protein